MNFIRIGFLCVLLCFALRLSAWNKVGKPILFVRSILSTQNGRYLQNKFALDAVSGKLSTENGIKVYTPRTVKRANESNGLMSDEAVTKPLEPNYKPISSPHIVVRLLTPKLTSARKLELIATHNRSSESAGRIRTSSRINVASRDTERRRERRDNTSKTSKLQKRSSKLAAEVDENEDYYEEDIISGADYSYGDYFDSLPADVSDHVLISYDQAGLSLTDIQEQLFIDYDVVSSVSAIEFHLNRAYKDARSGRPHRGKTRRDRQKSATTNSDIGDTSDTIAYFPSNYTKISVFDTAALLNVSSSQVTKWLLRHKGILCGLHDFIDVDTAIDMATNRFGREVEFKNISHGISSPDTSLQLEFPRHAVVTVFGHVNHGKTTLLDYISNGNVALSESGGITQSVRAFKVSLDPKRFKRQGNITFIDTPGHSAFGDIRRRGANLTDIVLLVIAADDGIMNQTAECIDLVRASNIPLVVAINKVDKDGANIALIKQQLLERDIILEEFGGDIQCSEISAATGQGVEDLIDRLMLQIELLAPVAPRDGSVKGVILDSYVDSKKGVAATVLIREGQLTEGQILVSNTCYGKVKSVEINGGKFGPIAGPSDPVTVFGLRGGIPTVGDTFTSVADETAAKAVLEARKRLEEISSVSTQLPQMVDLFSTPREKQREVNFVIKSESLGSAAAIESALSAISNEHCRPIIKRSGIGLVSVSDIDFATATRASVLAFKVGTEKLAQQRANACGVSMKGYDIIYDLITDVEKMLADSVVPSQMVSASRLKVKKVFTLRNGVHIAGCMVEKGSAQLNQTAKVLRRGNTEHIGPIESLKVGTNDVTVVQQGNECGIQLETFSDFEIGDIIETF